MKVVQCEIGRDVSKQGHAFNHFAQRCQTAEITQEDVRHGPVAQAAQRGFQLVVVGEGFLQGGQKLRLIRSFFPQSVQFGNQGRLGLEEIAQVTAVVERGLPAGIEVGFH